MDPERWRRIEHLYHSALERAPDQRNTFLTEACEADAELRQKVESLLLQSASTNDLVGKPVWEAVADMADTRTVPTPGTRLGPYEILAHLGEGGMGKVYRAVDRRLDRPVAIKISDEQFSERFDREARSISALNHPHICTLYDVGVNYLVMELVEGDTLAQRIDRAGPLPLREALDIGCQIAEALEVAHHKGIVHRDLKPANVKITPEGAVKVLDFGLAKAIRRETPGENLPQMATVTGPGSVAGHIVGTPA